MNKNCDCGGRGDGNVGITTRFPLAGISIANAGGSCGHPRWIEVDLFLLEPVHGDGQEVGLEIAVRRRPRADAVEGNNDGLSVF
jgi:hypothetical protein